MNRTRITTCYPYELWYWPLVSYQDYHILLLTLAGRGKQLAAEVAALQQTLDVLLNAARERCRGAVARPALC